MSPEEQDVLHAALEGFLDEDVIGEVLEVVRGGKEATVFRCRERGWRSETCNQGKLFSTARRGPMAALKRWSRRTEVLRFWPVTDWTRTARSPREMMPCRCA